MNKWSARLQAGERGLFAVAHRRSSNPFIDRWLHFITHAGGAAFTLSSSLLLAWLAQDSWRLSAWHAFAAVVLSHLPVFIIKRVFKRLRPYQALEQVYTVSKPLKDPSFPSGHTTAVFAWLTPFVLGCGAAWPLIWPLAALMGLSVAWSRIYLGLHYPSDVAIGSIIGVGSAIIVVQLNLPFPLRL